MTGCSFLMAHLPGLARLPMEIRLNGKTREVADRITVGRLLEDLKLQPLRVAVQVNMDIIKRERYEEVALQPGDAVEVLTFMSGG